MLVVDTVAPLIGRVIVHAGEGVDGATVAIGVAVAVGVAVGVGVGCLIVNGSQTMAAVGVGYTGVAVGVVAVWLMVNVSETGEAAARSQFAVVD